MMETLCSKIQEQGIWGAHGIWGAGSVDKNQCNGIQQDNSELDDHWHS